MIAIIKDVHKVPWNIDKGLHVSWGWRWDNPEEEKRVRFKLSQEQWLGIQRRQGKDSEQREGHERRRGGYGVPGAESNE